MDNIEKKRQEYELLEKSARELMRNSKFEEALESYQKSLELKKTFLEENDLEVLKTNDYICQCYTALCRYEDAIELYMKTLEIRDAEDRKPIFKIDIAYCCDSIAENYSLMHNHEEALKFYLKSLPIYDLINQFEKTLDYAIIYRNIANQYIYLNKDMEAIPYFFRSIAIKEFLGYLDPDEIIEDWADLKEVAQRCGDQDTINSCDNGIYRLSNY